MAERLTQSTADDTEDGSAGHGCAAVVRWSFPLPPLPPLWLDRPAIVIGRHGDCDVALPGNRVSRRHVQIVRSGPLWIITDLQSKNGLYVNAKRVTQAVLAPGDVLRIGDVVGLYLEAPRAADLSCSWLDLKICGGFAHRAAVARARELASSDLPVVVEGATGTGKERFAEALHAWSGRRGRFVAVNCAVYSKSVAAAELFGYRKGAFTGADQPSTGHVRAAEGGTLLLDELVELPLDIQAMLLRVIENREVLALGETRAVPINVRFVAATQTPLAQAVEQGRFRADLRARLEGAVIRLPALGACREIVPELFSALYELHTGRPPSLSTAFAEGLCLHEWPFNVRGLDMLARRLAGSGSYRSTDTLDGAALEEIEHAASAALPSQQVAASRKSVPAPGRNPGNLPYGNEEMKGLLSALSQSGGNLTKAAAVLGLSRPKAYRMLEAAKRAGLIV